MDYTQIKQQLNKDKKRLDKITKEAEVLKANIAQAEDDMKNMTKDECIAICLDAMIVGVDGLRARHGEIAPYSTGYYVNSHNSLVEHAFCEPVTADEFPDLPEKLYNYFIKKGWSYDDFLALKKRSDALWNELPTAYTPNFYPKCDDSLHGHHIANGYEDDGFDNIVAGYLGGTYSSWTTGRENELARFLIVLKGFCPDGFFTNMSESRKIYFNLVREVYSRHGIDADLEDDSQSLFDWAKRNPTRCMSNKPFFIAK